MAIKIPLKELCTMEITDGTHKTPTYSEEGYIFLSSKNVTSGKIDWDNVMYIPEKLHHELYKRLAPQKNDILLAKNGTTGVAAIVDRDNVFDIYVSLALIRPNQKKVIPKYLLYAINSDAAKRYFDSHLKGVGVPNLHLTHIRETPISVPNFDTQRQIITKLDKVSDLIAKRRQQLDKLDLLIKSRFVEMFGTFPANEQNWPVGKIRDVIQEARYGSSRPAVEGGQYPYLRMNNITYNGELDLTDIKQIDVPESELPKCTVQYGDVLFNRTNSKELVGKTCVYDRDEMMVLAGFVIRVRVNERVLPVFLSRFLNTDFSKQMLLGMCKTAIGQANINAQEMQNIGIYIPPIELQKKFVDFENQVKKTKTTISRNLEKLETLKKALMQEYFG